MEREGFVTLEGIQEKIIEEYQIPRIRVMGGKSVGVSLSDLNKAKDIVEGIKFRVVKDKIYYSLKEQQQIIQSYFTGKWITKQKKNANK